MLHLLNLACIKHTGQPLPSSATGANRWRYLTEDCYDLDDNGEVIPKVKKLAILRGVPDIRPCVIHDDPDLAICRQLIVGELNERMNIHRGEGILRRAMGSMGLTIWLMKHYRQLRLRTANPPQPDLSDSPMEVMKFLSTHTCLTQTLAKILISYWSSGEYNFHYDYVRFRRICREMTPVEFIEWIKKRLLLDRSSSFDPAYELGAFRLRDNYYNTNNTIDTDTAGKCLVRLSEFYTNPNTNQNRRQTGTIKAFFHTCKADRIYVGVDKLPAEISEENLKFYKKFWDRKPDEIKNTEVKLMANKWSKFDVKDAKFNSKILTGSGSVRKTKFAVDSYYELCMIAIGSSLDLSGAIWCHYTATRWGRFNQSGRPDWRLATRKKYSEKLSSDEILRIFAPDKKEEKKIVMDKFVASFSE